jgi:hypothetical protein
LITQRLGGSSPLNCTLPLKVALTGPIFSLAAARQPAEPLADTLGKALLRRIENDLRLRDQLVILSGGCHCRVNLVPRRYAASTG